MHKTILTCILLLVISDLAFAQSRSLISREITWNTDTDTDLLTGSTYPSKITFVSDGLAKIEMHIGTVVQVFDVVNAQSIWTDPTRPGEAVYNIELNGEGGMFTIKRNNDGLFIELDMRPSGPDGIHRLFSVTTFQYND